MFSTNAGDALPVRTPANSFTTTCSVLIILSSASSKKSSSAISAWTVAKPFKCVYGSLEHLRDQPLFGFQIFEIVPRAHHGDADGWRIRFVGFHPWLDIFDHLEEQMICLLIFQAGELLDIARRAIN